MSMTQWTMDPAIYGIPDVGMQVQTSREFTPILGDKAETLYRSYNQTAPLVVSATFGWYGDVLAQFRQAWEDQTKLCFGAAWFNITLPAYFARIPEGEYPAHCVSPFQASLAGLNYWKVTLSLDIDPSPQLVYGS